MSKVPCGGFKLDENFLGMNENDELSLTGGGEGKAYQYVVTDGEGNVKWEDRLAYDDSRVVIDLGAGMQIVKVSDEVPSWASVGTPMKIWGSNGDIITTNPQDSTDLGNGSFEVKGSAFFITTDNFESNGYVFPEKGVYFGLFSEGVYVAGVSSFDSDTPKITWDGNVRMLKTIDPKYIPSELNEIILPSSTSGSTKQFKITVNDSGTSSTTEVSSH